MTNEGGLLSRVELGKDIVQAGGDLMVVNEGRGLTLETNDLGDD